jgi:glutaredoxin
MNIKLVLISALFLVVAAFSSYALFEHGRPQESGPVASSTAQSEKGALILYYGNGCPHCANVDKYIKDNAIESKISITHKEVYGDQQNAAELVQRAKSCGLPTDSVGVPFLWDGSKCLIGDVDIIDYLASTTAQNI